MNRFEAASPKTLIENANRKALKTAGTIFRKVISAFHLGKKDFFISEGFKDFFC
jgi:hypothetical protein